MRSCNCKDLVHWLTIYSPFKNIQLKSSFASLPISLMLWILLVSILGGECTVLKRAFYLQLLVFVWKKPSLAKRRFQILSEDLLQLITTSHPEEAFTCMDGVLLTKTTELSLNFLSKLSSVLHTYCFPVAKVPCIQKILWKRTSICELCYGYTVQFEAFYNKS